MDQIATSSNTLAGSSNMFLSKFSKTKMDYITWIVLGILGLLMVVTGACLMGWIGTIPARMYGFFFLIAGIAAAIYSTMMIYRLKSS
ncbi:MAG: hypothetical protein R3E91_01110 [Chlamydiales bacterium]